MIDFDNVYNIFVGEAGSDTMASATLLDLLNKRLEFFQLQDKVTTTWHTHTHIYIYTERGPLPPRLKHPTIAQ